MIIRVLLALFLTMGIANSAIVVEELDGSPQLLNTNRLKFNGATLTTDAANKTATINIDTASGSGTVTSVGLIGDNGVTISNSPITTSGNMTVSFDIAGLTITESQISDLSHTVDTNTNADTICSGNTTYLDGQGNCDDISSVYAAASHTHAASDITSGTFSNARISSANVTQHQSALVITESQISDLSHTTDTTRSQEEIEDFVGGMVTGNTETGITVTYEDSDGTLDFVATDVSATNEIQNLFQTINAPSGTDPVADSSTDTLNLVAGANVTITGDSSTDTITIAATGGGGSGTMTTVKEGGTQLGGADIVTLDFGAGFDLTESPDTEVNIVLDYTEDPVDLSGSEVTGTLDISDHTNLAGTSNEVELSGDTVVLSDTIDIGAHTSFELPNSATPTTNAAGEIALDTTITDHQPLLQYYDGGENMTVIAIDTSELPAADDEIVKYDAASDKFVLEADGGAGGGGSPGGSNEQLQYNNGGVFSGTPKMIFDETSGALEIESLEANGIILAEESISFLDVVTPPSSGLYRNGSDLYYDSGESFGLRKINNKVETTSDFTLVGITLEQADFTGAATDNVGLGEGIYGAVAGTLTGSDNICIGNDSCTGWSGAASDNIVIGDDALNLNTTGSNNIIIGSDIELLALASSNALNIGNTIFGNTNNGEIQIGGSATEDPVVTLDVRGGIGIDGTTCLDVSSDRIYHDTDCDGTKDAGEEFIDQTGGGSSAMDTIRLVPIDANVPTANGGVLDLGSNMHKISYDDSTDESNSWTNIKIANYAGGALTAKIGYSMASATANEVIFNVEVWCVSDGDSADIDTESYDSVNASSATTVPGTAGYLDEISITLTNKDSVADGDVCAFRLTRDANNAGDDATGDAEVRYVEISE